MVIQVAAKSDIGCCREKNEDSFFVDSVNGLFIICDGMGGHVAGEVAAQKAIELTVDFLTRAKEQRILPTKRDRDFSDVWCHLIVESIENSCDQMIDFAESHPEFVGMATTITVVQIVEGVAFVGHLGDCRLYLKHGDVVKQLTSDHTLFEEFAQANPNWISANTESDMLKRFKHILTKCVGRQRDFNVDVFSFQLCTDDVLLLCTDGLSNYLTDEETVVNFLAQTDLDFVVKALIDFANLQGGSDNITAIVIQVLSLEDSDFDEFFFQANELEFVRREIQ